jgi:hypothetical protein
MNEAGFVRFGDSAWVTLRPAAAGVPERIRSDQPE